MLFDAILDKDMQKKLHANEKISAGIPGIRFACALAACLQQNVTKKGTMSFIFSRGNIRPDREYCARPLLLSRDCKLDIILAP